MSASINQRFSNPPQQRSGPSSRPIISGFSWNTPKQGQEVINPAAPAGSDPVKSPEPQKNEPPVQTVTATKPQAPKIDFGFMKKPSEAQQKPVTPPVENEKEANPQKVPSVSVDAATASDNNNEHQVSRYALMSSYGPIVAALAHEPDFQSLSSSDKGIQTSAGQTALELMQYAARAVGVMREAGIKPGEAAIVANKIVSDAWKLGSPMDAVIDNLSKYAARIVETCHKHNMRDPVIGTPSLKEINRAEKGADDFMKVQSGVSAMFSGMDKGLVNWFINEVRSDRIDSIVGGLRAADDFMKNDVSTAFMSDEAKSIVRLSAAASLSHVENIHASFTAQAGSGFTDSVMGTRETSIVQAKKSIVSASIDAVDEMVIPETGVISDVSVAQAIASMINETGKPWIDSRIDLAMAAWNTIPVEQRKNGKLAADFAFTESMVESISEKRKGIVKKGLESRALVTQVIAHVTNPDFASSQIKTRSALVKAGLTNERDISEIERIITHAAGKVTQKPKSAVPSLSEGGNDGIQYMTVCAVLRDISRASVSGLIKKTGLANVEMVSNSLSLAMDGMQIITQADMSDIKRAIMEATQDLYPVDDQKNGAKNTTEHRDGSQAS